MGKISVKGTATRTVNYDVMEIRLIFRANARRSGQASMQALKQCEEFLERIVSKGFDISKIELAIDVVKVKSHYGQGDEGEYFCAERGILLKDTYNAKSLNAIHDMANSLESDVEFYVKYYLMQETELRQEIIKEALLDARKKANSIAEAIGQKVIGLLSAGKESDDSIRRLENEHLLEVLCQQLECDDYENSNMLNSSTKDLTEYIDTVWEIG